MSKDKLQYGYGPKNALAMDTIADAAIRFNLANTINPEVTKGMRFPHKFNQEGWWIEMPNLPDKHYFGRIIKNLIDEAEMTVHPDVMSQHISARFVPDIFLRDRVSKKVIESSGQTVWLNAFRNDRDQRALIEVSLSQLKQRSNAQRRHWIYFAIRTIFHEIFELDYNVRMRQGEIPLAPKSSEFDPNYNEAPHEVYATNKAAQMIQEVFSNAPNDFRQKAFGFAEEKEVKVQTTAMNQLSAAILRFLAEKK